jgi:hypothetical protein
VEFHWWFGFRFLVWSRRVAGESRVTWGVAGVVP